MEAFAERAFDQQNLVGHPFAGGHERLEPARIVTKRDVRMQPRPAMQREEAAFGQAGEQAMVELPYLPLPTERMERRAAGPATNPPESDAAGSQYPPGQSGTDPPGQEAIALRKLCNDAKSQVETFRRDAPTSLADSLAERRETSAQSGIRAKAKEIAIVRPVHPAPPDSVEVPIMF